MNRMIHKSKVLSHFMHLLLLVIVLLGVGVVMGPHRAEAAATSDLPNQADFSSNDLHLMVADYGGSYELDARQSVVKIFFTQNSGTVTIFDGNICRYPAGKDSISGDPTTLYRMYRATAGESRLAALAAFTASSFNCASRNLTLSIGGLTKSTVPGHENFYVAYFYADITGFDAISSFRLRSSTGFVSYFAGSSSKFALGQAYILPQRYANYKLTFAPQCSLQLGQTQSATIRWYDADNGNGNQDIPLGSRLVKIAPNGTRTQVTSWTNLPGGNALPGSPDNSYTFTAQGRYKYEWDFTNVQSQNGIQFQLPYDSINYNINCDVPPTINSFPVDCTTATVVATTQANHLYDARLIIDYDGVLTPADDISDANGGLKQGIPSGSPVSFDVSSWKDFGTRNYYVRVRDKVNGLSTTTVTIRTRGPCLQFACGIPAIGYNKPPEAGQQFTATANYRIVDFGTSTSSSIGSRGNNYNYFIRLQIIPFYPAMQIGSGTLTPGLGNVNATSGNITAPPTLGIYDASTSIRNIAGGANLNPPGPCNDSADDTSVSALPYFKLLGGDIATGISSCNNSAWTVTPPGGGTLTAWNNGVSGAGNLGAGTNLAAFALGEINGFASAQATSGSSPLKDLSFSNTAGNPTYGGGFLGGIPCPIDYYGTLPAGTPTLPSSDAVQNTNTAYTRTGPFTLLGGNITGGNRTVIYVDGDVRITSNITLSSGATIDLLSSFYLVVKGNIYITPGVSQLDGVYVAQPDPTKPAGTTGKIYTCSSGFGPPSMGDLNDVCKDPLYNPLMVFGAFIAKELKLYRSIGSLSTGPPAEVFNATPATWLAAPCAISGCGSGSDDGYDAITSLPPIL